MSTTSTIAKLREEQKKIEKLLEELEQQKKTVDKQYASAMEDENKVYEELRKCRDTVQYNKLQIRVNAVTRRRKQVEAKKQEVDRRLRGYRDELEKVKARIEYMKPKGDLVSYKNE
jgi:predicted  nucleic acid-binding Zn-ribbon protein